MLREGRSAEVVKIDLWSTDLRDTATGWRIWYTDPADDTPALYSPYWSSQARRFRHPASKNLRMRCGAHGDHSPPEPDCTCGIYAVESVIDALYRLLYRTTELHRRRLLDWPDRAVPVLARMTMHRVRRGSDDEVFLPEIRAGTAEIERLYLPDDLITFEQAARLAERLSGALGVPVEVDYPCYTLDDWQNRPLWYFMPDETPKPGWPRLDFKALVPSPGQIVCGCFIARNDPPHLTAPSEGARSAEHCRSRAATAPGDLTVAARPDLKRSGDSGAGL